MNISLHNIKHNKNNMVKLKAQWHMKKYEFYISCTVGKQVGLQSISKIVQCPNNCGHSHIKMGKAQ